MQVLSLETRDSRGLRASVSGVRRLRIREGCGLVDSLSCYI